MSWGGRNFYADMFLHGALNHVSVLSTVCGVCGLCYNCEI